MGMFIVKLESKEKCKWLDRCLENLKSILHSEANVFDLSSIASQGNIVLLKIIGYYPTYGLIDNEFAPSDSIDDFLRIMEAKLNYITVHLNQSEYSLYKLSEKQRDYYVQQGYLPIRIGPYDVAAGEKIQDVKSKNLWVRH